MRNDQTPVNINDIFFTYNTIIKQNTRQVPQLDAFANISITQPSNDEIVVEFPRAAYDNWTFFLNKILPAHLLWQAPRSRYTDTFGKNPLGNTCAFIDKSLDTDSLIINTTICKDTYPSYYQVKIIGENTTDFADILIGDVYRTWDIYTSHQIVKNKILGVFFNTQTKKFSPRIQRAMGWLLVDKIYTPETKQVIEKNHLSLTAFLSKGDGLKEYIDGYNPNSDLEKKDLELLNIPSLKNTITVQWDTHKSVYLFDRWSYGTGKTLQISMTDNQISYTWYRVSANFFSGAQSFDAKKPITLAVTNASWFLFEEWRNQITIIGRYETFDKKQNRYITQEREVARIDIYVFTQTKDFSTFDLVDKVYTLIYYHDRQTESVIPQLKKIFADAWIADYVVFERYDDSGLFTQALEKNAYDIALRVIDMGQKQDISSLFLTDEAIINPSRYSNERFSFLIQQAINEQNPTKKQSLISDMNVIYANDMPVVFLGNVIEPVAIRASLTNKYYHVVDEYLMRKTLYNEIKVVTRRRPDKDKMLSFQTVKDFFGQYRNPQTQSSQ